MEDEVKIDFKVYALGSDQWGYDYVVARNLDECMRFDENGVTPDEVRELTDDELDNHYVLDLDNPEPQFGHDEYDEDQYCNGYKIKCTFREVVNEAQSPDLFCTTEF